MLVACSLILGCARIALGQSSGLVNFANYDLISGVNAPFYGVDGTTRLSGPGFRAALYSGSVGSPPNSWSRVSPAQPFRTGALAGFWVPVDVPVPAPANTSIGLQVRFWDSLDGTLATYEDAEAAGAPTGVSQAIIVVLGGPPTPMLGLKSAGLVPTITLTRGAPSIVTTSTTVPEGTQLSALCGMPVGTNRWFRLTSAYSGEAIVTTVGSAIDTVMSAYTGSIISPTALTLITCNDDRAPNVTASEIRFAVETHTLYLLCVAGKNGAEGTIRLNHALATSLLVRCAQPGWIELSWPADATNFFPEMTTNFFESASWSSITNTPLVFTNRRVLHLERAASREIYRLRLNPAP